jgi:hypothetical protein
MNKEKKVLLQTQMNPDFFLGSMNRTVRLLVVSSVFATGLLLQTFVMGVVGAGVLLIGVALALPRNVTNKPKTLRTGGDWKKVTTEEFKELFRMEAQSKAWGVFALDIDNLRGIKTLGLFLVGAAAAVAGAYVLQGAWHWESALLQPTPGLRAELLIVDLGLLFLPVWIFGLRSAWSPSDLLLKVRCLNVILERTREYPDPDARVSPMLQVAALKDGSLPTDARLLITWPKGPEELIGLQIQVSLNHVQGKAYPYLYGVVIARKGFGLGDREYRFPKDVVKLETQDDEVDVLVVRQRTSKNSGYETKTQDQIRIFEEAMEVTRDHAGLTVD